MIYKKCKYCNYNKESYKNVFLTKLFFRYITKVLNTYCMNM